MDLTSLAQGLGALVTFGAAALALWQAIVAARQSAAAGEAARAEARAVETALADALAIDESEHVTTAELRVDATLEATATKSDPLADTIREVVHQELTASEKRQGRAAARSGWLFFIAGFLASTAVSLVFFLIS